MGLRSYVGSSWSYAPRMTASEAFWALEHAMKRSRRGSPRSLLKMRVAPTAPQSPPWIATRRERQRSQYSDRCLWGGKTFMLGAGRTPAAPRPAGALLSAVVGPIQRNPPGNILPFSDEVVGSHLAGEVHAGLYPLLRGDACRLLVCDFDGTGWLLDALAYLDAARGVGIPVALERSRSGDGAHVWAFFSGPVAASLARQVGAHLLREAMTIRAELDLASYDRLFPAQDFMPKGSFGNLIALPLNGECRKRGDDGLPRSLEA